MAIVWEGGAFFHYCLFPLLLGRDNWFLCGNKVSTTHGSRLRQRFNSKEGWRGSRGGNKKKKGTRDEAKEEIDWESKSTENQQAIQLFAVTKTNSQALGGCRLDNDSCLVFQGLYRPSEEHSFVIQLFTSVVMFNAPNGKHIDHTVCHIIHWKQCQEQIWRTTFQAHA